MRPESAGEGDVEHIAEGPLDILVNERQARCGNRLQIVLAVEQAHRVGILERSHTIPRADHEGNFVHHHIALPLTEALPARLIGLAIAVDFRAEDIDRTLEAIRAAYRSERVVLAPDTPVHADVVSIEQPGGRIVKHLEPGLAEGA